MIAGFMVRLLSQLVDRFLTVEKPVRRCLATHPLYKEFLCTADVGHFGPHTCRVVWEGLPDDGCTPPGKEGRAR